jgi:hypothetical protein
MVANAILNYMQTVDNVGPWEQKNAFEGWFAAGEAPGADSSNQTAKSTRADLGGQEVWTAVRVWGVENPTKARVNEDGWVKVEIYQRG